MKLCQGCQVDKYKLVYETLESESEQLLMAEDGTPAALLKSVCLKKGKSNKIFKMYIISLARWFDKNTG